MASSLSKNLCATQSIHDNKKLDPWFITGFTDAEGSFSVSLVKDKSLRSGWAIKYMFKISLHIKDYQLLQEINTFFGVGGVTCDLKNNTSAYRVHDLENLVKIIFPHFQKYPLLSNKQADFLLFQEIIAKMYNDKGHLTEAGFLQIVSLRASLNNGLSPELAKLFPNVIPSTRPSVSMPKLINKYWIAGFTSGDGSFKVIRKVSKTHKSGYQIYLLFEITQNLRDELLLRALINQLGCGGYSYDSINNTGVYSVSRFTDILNIIIPLFIEYEISGVKALDFQDWCKIAEIIKVGGHLTPQGSSKIFEIKSGMN